MRRMRLLSQVLVATMAAVLASSGLADGVVPGGAAKCGVIDLSRVIRESAPGLSAREKLQREFEQIDAQIVEQTGQYKALEANWRAAMDSGEVERASELRKQADDSRAALDKNRQQFRQAVQVRQNQEVGILIAEFQATYFALGDRDGYGALYQTSEAKPVWSRPGFDPVECSTKNDLTGVLIQELAGDSR